MINTFTFWQRNNRKNAVSSFVSILCFGLVTTPLMYAENTYAETSFDFSGKVEVETIVFQDEGQFDSQDYQHNFSTSVEPELYWGWNDDYDSLVFTPFIQVDEQDEERTHFDIRELLWTHVTDNWEFRTGISKVFWGVAEFNHLVDVINQSDLVNSFDGEEKLGQPMIVASTVTDLGIFDFYVLPGFREQTAAGVDGRFRSSLVVNTDSTTYESDDEEQHIDYAVRWSHSVDVYDFGLYGFKGTDRSPTYTSITSNGTTFLQANYEQITQYGFDLQATIDSWLIKFEGIAKSTNDDDYLATQAGFEYTFYGIADSFADLGVLVEYGWDERGTDATAIAQNDIYLGARLALNNTDDTAILFGMSYDNDFYSKTALIEASQRLNDDWSIALDATVFIAGDSDNLLSSLDQDDNISLTLERFF